MMALLDVDETTEYTEIKSHMLNATSLDDQLAIDKAVADGSDEQARFAASTINESEDDQELVQDSVGDGISDDFFSIGTENSYATGDLTNEFETASSETTIEPSDPSPSNDFDFTRPDQG